MTRLFNAAWVVLTTAVTLTFLLTGFTIYNFDDLEAATEEPFGCATVNPVTPSPIAESLDAHPGAAIYKANCKACHRVDQALVGPALRGAYSRVPNEEWLRSWIRNSSKLIASGDPYAEALFTEYKRSQMTSFTNMSKEDMDNLVSYLRELDSEMADH